MSRKPSQSNSAQRRISQDELGKGNQRVQKIPQGHRHLGPRSKSELGRNSISISAVGQKQDGRLAEALGSFLHGPVRFRSCAFSQCESSWTFSGESQRTLPASHPTLPYRGIPEARSREPGWSNLERTVDQDHKAFSGLALVWHHYTAGAFQLGK